jgi:hypothetical protein
MKAKDYKSRTDLLNKKYKRKFFNVMTFLDCLNRINQRKEG